MSEYSEKFKDPKWQKVRLKVLERDKWACQKCRDTKTTLHVHHRYYTKNKEPWEYPLEAFITLCKDCHEEEGRTRPEYEKTMLFVLSEKFLADEVFELACAFHEMELLVSPKIVANAFALALKDEEIQRTVLNIYYNSPIYKRIIKSRMQRKQIVISNSLSKKTPNKR